MSKEEAEREKQSGDGRRGSFGANQYLSRTSTDRVINKAEPKGHKPAPGASLEDTTHDRTLTAVRSPSPDKPNGVPSTTLPVVEEVGEANSREDSMHNEKVNGVIPGKITTLLDNNHPHLPPSQPSSTVPPTPAKDDRPLDKELPPIPHLSRFSMTETLAAQLTPNSPS
jgi:hypothetical protein